MLLRQCGATGTGETSGPPAPNRQLSRRGDSSLQGGCRSPRWPVTSLPTRVCMVWGVPNSRGAPSLCSAMRVTVSRRRPVRHERGGGRPTCSQGELAAHRLGLVAGIGGYECELGDYLATRNTQPPQVPDRKRRLASRALTCACIRTVFRTSARRCSLWRSRITKKPV